MRYLILLEPSTNRVYQQQAGQLAAAELAIVGGSRWQGVQPVELAGVDYLEVTTELAEGEAVELLSRCSVCLAIFARAGDGELLRPVQQPDHDQFDDDLVTIPKYAGKTNEQFTRLMIDLAAASAPRLSAAPAILDPLCGRGTTLSVGLTLGFDVAGVEADDKAVESYAAFLKTYLRRKRIKHGCELNPVRRDGRSLGRRLDATITSPRTSRQRQLTVFTGDTRDSAALYGKRRFDLVVTDAPYGIAHRSRTAGGGAASARTKNSRSAADLLTEAVPVWAGQLKPGGALALAWNTYGMTRESLTEVAGGAGLRPLEHGPYLRLAHRVDSSIQRDLFLAVKDV